MLFMCLLISVTEMISYCYSTHVLSVLTAQLLYSTSWLVSINKLRSFKTLYKDEKFTFNTIGGCAWY